MIQFPHPTGRRVGAVVAVALYASGRAPTPPAMRSACWATMAWPFSQGQPNGVVKYLIGKRAWIFGPRIQLELAVHAARMKPACRPTGPYFPRRSHA